MQRVRIGFISSLLSVIILLTAAFTNAAPLSAIAMNEGRTYDQAHDTGYIDWSGSAQYVYCHTSRWFLSAPGGRWSILWFQLYGVGHTAGQWRYGEWCL